MPTFRRDDDKPVVQFDPLLEISPFTVFRRLDEGPPLVLVDVRREPQGKTLSGALPYPGDDWEPPEDEQVVLFDQDGSEAEPIARRLQAAGYQNVKMLFGGLELYEFSLDPRVVGERTYLDDLQ